MRDLTNNGCKRKPQVNNLNVRNNFAKVAGHVVLAGCISVGLFAFLDNKYPFVVDKEGRYTTETQASFAFRDDDKYNKNIYEFESDESTGIGTVKRYNGNFRSYDDLEKLVETANEEGPEILVKTIGEPIEVSHSSWYFTKREQDKGSCFKVIYSDNKGDFVIEDESFRNNLVTTLAPVLTGAFAGLLVSATDDKEKSLKI